MPEIALRVYTEPKNKKRRKDRIVEHPNYDTVFAFDTETTVDEYQNLKFGSFVVHSKSGIFYVGLFYNSLFVSVKELKELKSYCKKHYAKLYTLDEFVEKVFYPTVYKKKVLCVGFNLPFDLSRLAIDYGYAKNSMRGGFVLKLHNERKHPPILIKHNSSSQSFIRFQSTSYRQFSGYFLDLKTFGVALTDDKHITLERVCVLFNEKYKKLVVSEHGKITQKYIEYNIADTLATHELFTKLKEEFDKYGIKIPLNEVYSSASLGKACLEHLGIKPFLELNPDFPKEILGFLMTAYYGGRVECKIRKQPTKVTVLDFTSMYPSMFTITGLWDFLIAEKIIYIDDTDGVRKFLENVTIDDLRKPETWRRLNALVEIVPDDDILPVRTTYDKETYNVGINYLKSKKPLWYSLADLVVSKLLTGKCPNVSKAIRFTPVGKQSTLRKMNVLGIETDPARDNLFKVLVEKKQEMKDRKDDRYKAVKILVNATSYGIFVEINREDRKDNIDVHGLEKFPNFNWIENTGKYFNPIISTFITSASRLALAIAELVVTKHGDSHAYMDTDSIFVPTKYAKEIQDFFKQLNPYNFDKPLFKVEENNVWFYGISSKRYVLYQIRKNNFIIKETETDENYSLHGLGHLLNPFGEKIKRWQKQIWIDILKLHYNQMTKEEFLDKYRNFYAISQLTVSSKELMKRFGKFNKRKPYGNQIKPFNFFLIGVGNSQETKPIAPFTKNPQEVVYKYFINYKTGKAMNGLEYWKHLNDELWSYISHKESKFEGNKGLLGRKHIATDSIVYIGKEANNIEKVGTLDKADYTIYQSQEKLKERILKMTPKEARLIGLNRKTFWAIKKRIRENKPLKLSSKIISKLERI